MLMFKKRKIKAYLNSLGDIKGPFDLLLLDYVSGAMKKELHNLILRAISIHVDWHDDVKCIGVQARYGTYYIDMQIYPDEFTIACDPGEADEDRTYPLVNRDQVYATLFSVIKNIHRH